MTGNIPEYTLLRSGRKTIAVYIRNGGVEVRAPLGMPKDRIDSFIKSKEEWIIEKLAVLNDRDKSRGSFTLSYGDYVLYRGKQYQIIEKKGERVGFDYKNFYMPPNLTAGQIKASVVRLYKILARHYLTERTLEFASKMTLAPSAVKITGAKSQWGSCSAKKSLNFSWRLILADDEVIDYIVVHELAHIHELNHSKRFWAIVENVVPDYKERKRRLKALQDRLMQEDWD
jgi:predicted metal-dependent hydrolase